MKSLLRALAPVTLSMALACTGGVSRSHIASADPPPRTELISVCDVELAALKEGITPADLGRIVEGLALQIDHVAGPVARARSVDRARGPSGVWRAGRRRI